MGLHRAIVLLTILLCFQSGAALAQNRIHFENYGARLVAEGPITAPLVEAVRAALNSNPLTTSVELGSQGGEDVTAARALRDLIFDKGLNTFVSAECNGLCAIAFLGGDRRFMTETAKIGFSAAPSDNDALRKESTEMGVVASFLDKAMGSSTVVTFTPDELLNAGVVSDVIPSWDEPRF